MPECDAPNYIAAACSGECVACPYHYTYDFFPRTTLTGPAHTTYTITLVTD